MVSFGDVIQSDDISNDRIDSIVALVERQGARGRIRRNNGRRLRDLYSPDLSEQSPPTSTFMGPFRIDHGCGVSHPSFEGRRPGKLGDGPYRVRVLRNLCS